ncbi:hypothetical protein Lgra_3166 [Legionella gratiana]|uniref:Uncharacterized protein n=1 Tax=Legionella gratiana TaxID=45066 RepID=A0A378JE90_9GAMM|nr:hypothetical protein [Legionella gratiana]KTD06389.1 hypothetical protein Lgra_3166 [Legionella gratiana]STX45207.1 Uncharacterised protein [Legionella gratiana]
MFTKEFLNKYAQELQTYKKATKNDAGIPSYVQGITNSLNEFFDKQSENLNGDTFKRIAEASKNGGDLFTDLEEKSGKKRTWTTVFTIGALAKLRKEKIIKDSPEQEHLDKIIDGLNQGWVEGFGGLSLSGISINKEVMNKLLGGIEGWVKSMEPNKPSPGEFSKTVIAAITLVNLLETKLIENKARVENILPDAFTSLAETKKELLLKAPQLAISYLAQDDRLLSELLTQQPEVALNLFKEKPSLIGSLSLIARIPDTFAKFLGNNSEFALELLSKSTDLKEQQSFIVSALLKSNPKHIETLLNHADLVKQIVQEDRELVRSIQSWLESEEARSKNLKAVEELMAPFQVKTTADVLAKLGTSHGAAPSLKFALENIQQKYDEDRKPLHEKQKRLAIFSKFINQNPLNADRFWINYPTEEKINQLCDDLGLKPDSTQREFLLIHVSSSLGSYLNKTINPWGPPKLSDIVHSEEIKSAHNLVTEALQQSLNPFKTQHSIIQSLEEQLEQLDPTLKKISLDEWIGSQQQFQQSIEARDSANPMQEIQKQAQALTQALTCYQKELDRLNAIASSINKLKESGVDVTEISRSLDQYVEAVYQQGEKLYGEKPENYSDLNITQKIAHLKNKIEEQIKATDTIKNKFSCLHNAAMAYNQLSYKTDISIIDHARNVINNSGGFIHWILNKFSSSYRETFRALKETVTSYDKLSAAQKNESVLECAAKIRGILLTTQSNNDKFITMKQAIQNLQQQCSSAPLLIHIEAQHNQKTSS